MNQEMIRVRKELLAKRDPERNIPCYLKGLAGGYYRQALYNLSMQYVAFSEAVKDGDIKLSEKTEKYAEYIRKLLQNLCNGDKEREEVPLKLGEIRKEITDAMQVLTAYTDRLYLHEYVLRRLAPGMDDTVEQVDAYQALEEMSGYLFCDEEQEGMLARVAQVVSELPIRMTKAKFMEWVRSTATVYKDSDGESLDRFFYMVRCASGLYEPEGMDMFPEFASTLEFFCSLDYRTITKEQFEEAKKKMEEVTLTMNYVSEAYFSLTELVNSLMVVYFTADYVSAEDMKATEGCMQVFRLMLSDKVSEEELAEAFFSFEGVPEELEEALLTEEAYFEQIEWDDKLIDAMMQRALFTRVTYAKRLHTTSIFAELQEASKDGLVFETELDKFCEELSKLLEEGQRALNRGIMAQVIFNLPLPFTKKSDIQQYILAALENCHDMSEKTASIRAIRELAEGIR